MTGVFLPEETDVVDAPAPATDETRTCPFCGEKVKLVAIKCRYCKKPLGNPDAPGAFRRGKYVVLSRAGLLPARCFKSNEPTTFTLQRTVTRTPVWALVGLLFFGPLGYFILAVASQKKARVHIPLTEAYVKRRRLNIAIGWVLLLGGIAAFFGGGASLDAHKDLGALILLSGILLFFVGLITILASSSLVAAERIEKDYVSLRGASREFLAGLPEWSAA
jgi:hypothetical protein